MAKKATKKRIDQQQRLVVIGGYALFSLTVVGLLVGFIPWIAFFQDPRVLHWNVLGIMIAFAVSALLPALAGYFLGDKATRNKSHLVHHYNGVLFGVLGFWLATALGMLSYTSGVSELLIAVNPTWLTSVLPVAVTLVILLVVGVLYVRSTGHQTSLLGYGPYKWLLIVSLVGLFVSSGVSAINSAWDGSDPVASIVVAMLSPVMMAALLAFGAWVLGKRNGSVMQRLLKSIIIASYALVTMNAIISLFYTYSPVAQTYSMITAIVVWILAMVLFRKFPSTQK